MVRKTGLTEEESKCFSGRMSFRESQHSVLVTPCFISELVGKSMFASQRPTVKVVYYERVCYEQGCCFEREQLKACHFLSLCLSAVISSPYPIVSVTIPQSHCYAIIALSTGFLTYPTTKTTCVDLSSWQQFTNFKQVAAAGFLVVPAV